MIVSRLAFAATALAAALISICSAAARADALPDRINFQGKLINPATNNPQAGPVSLTFKLYNVPSGGVALYTETQNNIALVNGVFSVQIGTVAAISRELFLGASAYLGVTVAGDTEMVPRQQLIMSAYAFTAHQLADASEVRLIAGTSYSTFTSAGNMTFPGGVQASSGSFTNGITASSGTFTATGSQYSIVTSSGIQMNDGVLDVTGTSGILANDTGIRLSSIVFTGQAADPASGSAGFMYYNTSSGTLKVFDGGGEWAFLFGHGGDRRNFITTSNTARIAVSKTAAAGILLSSFDLAGPMTVNSLHCIVVTTALGAAGDIGVYNDNGTLVLNGGSGSLSTAAGLKTVAPVQTGSARFLPPGEYYAAVTYNSTTGNLGGDTLGAAGAINGVGYIATGGGSVLPASITPSSIVPSTVYFFFEMNP